MLKKLFNEKLAVETIPHQLILLNGDNEKKKIIFGATGGTQDRRKGFELLETAYLKNLMKNDDINLIVFGGNNKNFTQKFHLKFIIFMK